MESKIKNFDGSADIKVFLEKITLHSSLKGYQDEKAAQNLASRLEGRAFDVYMRLSQDDKKDVEKIKSELLKEFEKGNQDREMAIHELNNRKRKPDESAQTFAFKIMELVKLAYPTFNEDTHKTIAKDYFVRGVHPKMQISLKALPDFDKADINKLAVETTRLQLAGIGSFAAANPQQCMNVDSPSLVDTIADKVIEKMKSCAISIPGSEDGGNNETANATYCGYRPFQNKRNANTNRGQFSRRPSNRGYRNRAQQTRKCRSCQSLEHLFRDCPTRFCQACGSRGHDAWDKACPNYQ